MPIETNNLVLYKSERLTDASDGGGKYSGQVVADGESNNLFPDVSELDRTMGRVSLRKIFAAVNNNDTESLMGSTVFVSKNPDDPNVSALLFSTRSHTDKRDAAKSRLEDYLVRGGVAVGVLLDTAYENMSIMQMIMNKEENPNSIGDTICLIKNEGAVNEFIQYVRIKRVDTSISYVDIGGRRREFKVATYTLEQLLLSTFVGVSTVNWAENGKLQTVVRNTIVADSGKYYASAKVVTDVLVGQYTVKAASIFRQLVPVGQSETPLIDLNPNGERVNLVVAGATEITQSYTVNTSTSQNLYIGSAIMPSSVSFSLRGSNVTDKGGLLIAEGGAQVATIDYQRGLIQWTQSAGAGLTSFDFTFKPAAAPLQTSNTQTKYVTEQTQSMNWTGSLVPLPSPTTVRVSYMSQGKFYELRDDGTGRLVADDVSIGTGTINYTTGSWLLTTGALPDVGSVILVQWGTPIATFERSNTAVKPLTLDVALEKTYIKNLSINWLLNGTPKTASVSSRGVISGDATGRINMATGDGKIVPNLLPQKDTEFTFSYDWGISSTRIASGTITGGTLNLTVGNGSPLTGGGVSIAFTVYDKTVTLHDAPIDSTSGNLFNGSSSVGTIDYVTGAVSISAASLPTETYISGYGSTYTTEYIPCPEPTQGGPWASAGSGGGGGITTCGMVPRQSAITPQYETRSLQDGASVTATVKYNDSGLSGANSEMIVFNNPVIDITNGYNELILAGSVRFKVGNSVYVDRDAAVYRNIDPLTGAGIASGTIAYGNGRVVLTGWNAGDPNVVALQSLCTTTDMPSISQIAFRTPVIPIRPQSITITVPTIEHGNLTLTADEDGLIDTTYASGVVDYSNGVVQLLFVQKLEITAINRADIESKLWYDSIMEYEEGGKTYINAPVWINPSAIRYNAISYSYTPLNPEILGVDTTRLPLDGRVPIFRVGDIGVIASSKKQELPSHVAGQTYNLNDQRISWCELEDSNGAKVPYDMYVVDYDYGKVTLSGDFALNTLVAPISAAYRYQDMGLINDVQINGQITLTKPVTHNYDADNSIVGSALVIGDMFSRYTAKFVQGVWNSVWADAATGASITPNYNDALYPIAVTNKGAIQERWAIVFTDISSFRIIGEVSGQIGTGSVNADCAPINPITNQPYFILKKEGWGTGWVSGNVLRFNTIAAMYPIWCIRTVKQSEPTVLSDNFQIMYRGDIDR